MHHDWQRGAAHKHTNASQVGSSTQVIGVSSVESSTKIYQCITSGEQHTSDQCTIKGGREQSWHDVWLTAEYATKMLGSVLRRICLRARYFDQNKEL